ncbi:uncharacterized protein METZ01_LOCUS57287 [marine metagenome]|uniref:DUF3311 domain-containing protein n=1 Tax=marine metagenome TaxID=408172 RepID=A0A381ST24_9ZZZZ
MPTFGLGSLALLFVAIFLGLIWPVYPLASRIQPFVFGLPFSLFYVLSLVLLSFVVLWLYDHYLNHEEDR